VNDTQESRPLSIDRRTLRLVVITAIAAALVAVASTMAALAATDTFTDVNAGDTHETGIDFMLDSGVTIGCTTTEYCPNDPVTRAQMATFMHRLSGTAPGTAASVNAATVGGLTVADIQAGLEAGDGGGDSLADRVAALEATVAELEALLEDVSRTQVNGNDTLVLSGMNLQVNNGTGSSVGGPNGLGNLQIGYDGPRPTNSNKAGSHYLVIGDGHNYTGNVGIVSGITNTVTGNNAAVLGGGLNTASNLGSTVAGGSGNQANGENSAVLGGVLNRANGDRSAVLGGSSNTAGSNNQILP
jgi:hypothetical protein